MIRTAQKRIAVFFAAMAIALFAALVPFRAAVVYADGEAAALYVHFVNVGQGDCTIIEFPDGKTMIIDGADTKTNNKNAIFGFIENTLPSDFKYFDYCIMTHSDSDHCGSLDDVLNRYPARVSYRPNVEANNGGYVDPGKADLTSGAVTKDTVAYKNCIEAMYKQNADFTPTVYVTSGDTPAITGGSGDDEYSLTFYSPLSESYSDWNNYSPIMVLEYRGFKFAMSGDAEKENETEFVQKVAAAKTDGVTDKYDVFTDTFNVNVIKAGHHGSRTSTSQAYIDVMTTAEGAKACYYIISCGEGNSYGHPHKETMTKLSDMGVPESNILRTDKAGDINISVKQDSDGNYALFNGDIKNKPLGLDPETEQEPTFFEKYKVWIIIAIVVVAIIVIAYIVYTGSKSSGKKRSGSSGSGRSSGGKGGGKKGSKGSSKKKGGKR